MLWRKSHEKGHHYVFFQLIWRAKLKNFWRCGKTNSCHSKLAFISLLLCVERKYHAVLMVRFLVAYFERHLMYFYQILDLLHVDQISLLYMHYAYFSGWLFVAHLISCSYEHTSLNLCALRVYPISMSNFFLKIT